MLFVSAGFDAHREDPLGGLMLEECDYRWVTDLIVDAAHRTASGRIVSTLEGGYHLCALASSVIAHLEGLLCAPSK
jgi:acetoin utilization deacetylase AcuC-like enzyme